MTVWIRTLVDIFPGRLAQNPSRILFETNEVWKKSSEHELGALLLNDATLLGHGRMRLIGGENKSIYKDRRLSSTLGLV
jgi:hypothetical protein